MKGLLIKSGERAQGRLILLLIRPDKAGTGPERGVPEPTAPVSCSPAQNRQHSQVSAARPGFGRVLGRGTGCYHLLTCLQHP